MSRLQVQQEYNVWASISLQNHITPVTFLHRTTTQVHIILQGKIRHQ